MAVIMQDEMRRLRRMLRYEPTRKRIRGTVAGDVLVDSRHALLVWEAGKVVPTYAVPPTDISAELVPIDHGAHDPLTPFRRDHGPGQELTVHAPGIELAGAAFRPDDPALAETVILDFTAFDRWREDDDLVQGHPRDPFHRVDARTATQHVRVLFDGKVLADTAHPTFVYETMLPVRVYIPRNDVDFSLIEPSDGHSICPYKGTASYWSVRDAGPEGRDIAWSYEQPLHDAPPIQGLIAFYGERTNTLITE